MTGTGESLAPAPMTDTAKAPCMCVCVCACVRACVCVCVCVLYLRLGTRGQCRALRGATGADAGSGPTHDLHRRALGGGDEGVGLAALPRARGQSQGAGTACRPMKRYGTQRLEPCMKSLLEPRENAEKEWRSWCVIREALQHATT